MRAKLAVLLCLGCVAAVAQVDFSYVSCLAFVKAKVNGDNELLFLVDTGANRSAVDPSALKQLGIQPHGDALVQGTVGTVRSQLATIDSISVGDASATGLTVTTLDLSGYLQPEGQKVSGILGYDFLRKFAIRIDFAKRQMSFLKAATDLDAMLPLAFRIDNGVPRFTATLNETVSADFRLDTGASLFPTNDIYVNVVADVWDKLQATDSSLQPETYFTGSGIGGEVKLPVARAKKMAIGELSLGSPFLIVQPRQGYFANKDAAGLISNNLLEKFSPVVIDYPGKKLYLTRKP